MMPYKIVTLDDIDSTNEKAKRRIHDGIAEEGLVLTARTQNAGRGRHGRNWSSPAGNLYLSVLLKSVAQNSQISFVAALAVADGIDWCCGQKVAQLKWPNDVLVNNQKICGILIDAEGEWLVVGIGVNVASAPAIAAYKATSLAEIGCTVSVEIARGEILKALFHRCEEYKSLGFGIIRDAWLERAWQLNQTIILRDNDQETRGTFTGLDENGFCLLHTAEGPRRFATGSFFAAAA